MLTPSFGVGHHEYVKSQKGLVMKKMLCGVSLLAVAMPISAVAQEWQGAVSLGYGMSDVSDISEDIDTLTFDGRVGYDFGNGIRIGADFSTVRGEMDNVPEGITGSVLGVYGAYGFSNGATVGIYAEEADLDIEGFPVDLSATSFGLMAGFETATSRVGGFVGKTTTDPDLPAGVDIRDFGLSFRHDVSEQFTLGGSFVRSEISESSVGVDIDFLGIAGAYEINPSWTIFGAISKSTLDVLDADVTTFGLGVTYDLSSTFHFGSSVSLELARSNASLYGDDGDLDTIRLGFNIPFGSRDFNVPMNSVADAVMNPRHSAVSSLILSTF